MRSSDYKGKDKFWFGGIKTSDRVELKFHREIKNSDREELNILIEGT